MLYLYLHIHFLVHRCHQRNYLLIQFDLEFRHLYELNHNIHLISSMKQANSILRHKFTITEFIYTEDVLIKFTSIILVRWKTGCFAFKVK